LQAENAGLLYLYIIGIAKLLYKKQPVFAIEYRQLAVIIISSVNNKEAILILLTI